MCIIASIMQESSPIRYIIMDVDTGSDDAWALFLLLQAERVHNLKIIGITCVNGNTSLDHTVENTLRLLTHLKRTDV